MTITAKELAEKLNISPAAVSMALNGKPGVSTQTRKKIIETAHKYSYDFSKIKQTKKNDYLINFIIYRNHGAVVNDSPFFRTLFDSVAEYCKNSGYKLNINHVFDNGDVSEQLNSILTDECSGILLLGTEMQKEDFFPFTYLDLPIVLIDTYFHSAKMDCVLINNVESSFCATNLLIKKYQVTPGYIRSSYVIYNFEERLDGFYKAIASNGMSRTKSIIHCVSPSIEGAYFDMKKIIERGDPLAKAYACDNDLIAIGVMKAFKEAGYKIPEDIALVGFDDLPLCTYVDPSLTTVNVPIKYMVQIAVDRLIYVSSSKQYSPIKIEINTRVVRRETT